MRKNPAPSLPLRPYSLLWRVARPFLARHKRLKDDFSLRMVPPDWQPPFAADLWIQAASGGEAFLVRQLLDALQGLVSAVPQRPLRILCTSCTRQGLDVLDTARQHGQTAWPGLEIAVRVFPLDEPEIIRRARDYASPNVVVLLETELWPGLMAACAEQTIPLITINGRMTEKSYSGYRWLAPLWKKIAPAHVLAMAEADASRFAALFGAERVTIMPNMKFDGVPSAFPASDTASSVTLLPPSNLPVILLASVREEEEPLLVPVLTYLREHAPEALLVVAPRHMERVPAWKSLLKTAFGPHKATSVSVLEQSGKPALPGTAVLWDRFGQLQTLYGRADAVFVGGSLAALGGQNFLEAAGQGLVPIIGPHWKNFAWVGESFFASGLGIQIPDAAALGPTILSSLHTAPNRETQRRAVAAYIDPRRGGSRQAAEAVLAVLASRQ